MFYVCKRTSTGISSIPIQSIDFNKRIIYIDDEITHPLADRFIEQILYLNGLSNDKITVFINADGTQTGAAMGICDIINLSTAPIRMICTCRASNMAAVIFLLADEKIMFPNAILSFEQIERQMGFVPASADNLKSLLPCVSKKAINFIRQKKIITAKDAIRYGLANKICDSSDLNCQERGSGLWI